VCESAQNRLGDSAIDRSFGLGGGDEGSTVADSPSGGGEHRGLPGRGARRRAETEPGETPSMTEPETATKQQIIT